MMSSKPFESHCRRYIGHRVLVDARRPELARWANVPGRIVAVNGNGRALVQFEGADRGWHDIDPEYLKWEPSDELSGGNRTERIG